MEPLLDFLSSLGSSSLRLFWLPLLVWSVLACGGYLLLRSLRSLSPRVQYQAHLALLLALPLTFLLAPLLPTLSLAPDLRATANLPAILLGIPSPSATTDAVVGLPVEVQETSLAPIHLAGLLTLVAGVSAGAFLLLFLTQLVSIRRLRQHLVPPESAPVAALLSRLRQQAGMDRNVHLGLGSADSVPMTFGWRDPVILLPPALLSDQAACRLVLRHELVHIRHNDYLWGLVERFCCSLFAIHPGVWLMQERIAFYREAACDAEVLADHPTERAHYARLLFSFARASAGVQAAILPMVKPNTNLKYRISAMKRLSPFTAGTSASRHLLLIGALLLIPAFIAACTVSVSNSDAPEGKGILSTGSPAAVADALPDVDVLPPESKYELHRLQVQIDYLSEQLEGLSRKLEAMEDESTVAKESLMRRAQLIQRMYMQRLEAYETLKLEAETERRLRSDRGYQELRAQERQVKKRAEMLRAEIQMLTNEIAHRQLELVKAQAAQLSEENLTRGMMEIEELKARLQVLQTELNQ